jgi:hypothetical protein
VAGIGTSNIKAKELDSPLPSRNRIFFPTHTRPGIACPFSNRKNQLTIHTVNVLIRVGSGYMGNAQIGAFDQPFGAKWESIPSGRLLDKYYQVPVATFPPLNCSLEKHHDKGARLRSFSSKVNCSVDQVVAALFVFITSYLCKRRKGTLTLYSLTLFILLQKASNNTIPWYWPSFPTTHP